MSPLSAPGTSGDQWQCGRGCGLGGCGWGWSWGCSQGREGGWAQHRAWLLRTCCYPPCCDNSDSDARRVTPGSGCGHWPDWRGRCDSLLLCDHSLGCSLLRCSRQTGQGQIFSKGEIPCPPPRQPAGAGSVAGACCTEQPASLAGCAPRARPLLVTPGDTH